MGFPGVFPIHFRTLYRFEDGISPIEAVAHSELQRVMFKPSFSRIKLSGGISPNVDYLVVPDEPDSSFVVSGDSTQDATSTRVGVDHLGTLKNTSATIRDVLSPSFSTVDGDVTPSVRESDGSLVNLIDLGYLDMPGFLRYEDAPGLIFCAVAAMTDASVSGTPHSDDCRMYVYAPVDGIAPEDYYGFRLPVGPDVVEIPESDGGTLFGVTLKKKGWSLNVPHDVGVEIYTPYVSIEEL